MRKGIKSNVKNRLKLKPTVNHYLALCVKEENVGKKHKIKKMNKEIKNIRKCSKMLENVGKYGKMLENVGTCWKMLENIKK